MRVLRGKNLSVIEFLFKFVSDCQLINYEF